MAARRIDSSQRYVRISDIGKESLQMHMPIRGYENMPLVSLEKAVEPLRFILPEIQDYAYVAKERCNPVPADDLTKDESASIMLYSMEWEPHDKCLYFALNSTLRSEDRRQLTPWFLYLKLILTALSRLPTTRNFVYRGVKMDLHEKYPTGKTFVWWGFSSCTSSIQVLENEQFLGKTGLRTLFTIDCNSGKDISRHSYYQTEKEILLLAARQFKVLACLQPAVGLHMIQLKEIDPPISLLQPATFDSDFERSLYADQRRHSHSPLTCHGRQCVVCGRCCDWYYTGRPEDWQWIRNFRHWDHQLTERWRSGNYADQFKLHKGTKCNRSIYYSASYFVRFVSFGAFDGSHLIGHLCVCD